MGLIDSATHSLFDSNVSVKERSRLAGLVWCGLVQRQSLGRLRRSGFLL